MTDTDEPDDLHALLTSAGWQRFSDQVNREWGSDGYAQKVSAVVAQPDDKLALDKLRLLASMRPAVWALMEWPSRRLRMLDGKAAAEPVTIDERMRELQAQDRVSVGTPRGGV